MSLETETVPNTPDTPQETVEPKEQEQHQVQEDEADNVCVMQKPAEDKKENERESTACSLASRSPVAAVTEDFLLHEKFADSSLEEPVQEPRTPLNSENEDTQEVPPPPQIVEVVSVYSETVVVNDETPVEEEVLNGHVTPEPEPAPKEVEPEPVLAPLTNGKSNGECKFEASEELDHKPKVLNGTIATELINEDYKLPDVVEVKKNFEHIANSGHNVNSQAPPKKGALSTNIDSVNVKNAYQDVRSDVTETQWAVFKFEGPTIVTSAKGSDFDQFKTQFGDDERAFGYIRVQTGDEMSKRAKFLLVTWIGPSVSILKRAKMSTDKALIKDILSNFAVELQTENITEINLQNFESELDKAAGAHYGTGIRS
ncbi:uncharacterized protein LOC126739255 [Anthonomus grandis grandis]|uniref:uncharacterized protein LOC126739255 n=1 Tax=Anthonomus grandis grandis TaxID=2921223 RepID=UPI0021654D1A|nr:uncharacterized protein LOC126739255 [Anthonomus grandis grandis]